jgi:membrane protein DedA with SNARE-associated domain
MTLLLTLYVRVLFVFVPGTSALIFNPVSMTDTNKAKEYGFGTAALVCAIISLLASVLCMYWFCRMEKRFRHRYEAIAIQGDKY